jgi:hypothetical protein
VVCLVGRNQAFLEFLVKLNPYLNEAGKEISILPNSSHIKLEVSYLWLNFFLNFQHAVQAYTKLTKKNHFLESSIIMSWEPSRGPLRRA